MVPMSLQVSVSHMDHHEHISGCVVDSLGPVVIYGQICVVLVILVILMALLHLLKTTTSVRVLQQ